MKEHVEMNSSAEMTEEMAKVVLDRLVKNAGFDMLITNHAGGYVYLACQSGWFEELLLKVNWWGEIPFHVSPGYTQKSILEELLKWSSVQVPTIVMRREIHDSSSFRTIEFLPAGMTLEKLLIWLDLEGN